MLSADRNGGVSDIQPTTASFDSCSRRELNPRSPLRISAKPSILTDTLTLSPATYHITYVCTTTNAQSLVASCDANWGPILVPEIGVHSLTLRHRSASPDGSFPIIHSTCLLFTHRERRAHSQDSRAAPQADLDTQPSQVYKAQDPLPSSLYPHPLALPLDRTRQPSCHST
jgi:hypothetical protein